MQLFKYPANSPKTGKIHRFFFGSGLWIMILSTVDSSSGNAINHWTDFNACTLLCLCSLCVILQFYIPVLTEWRRNFAVYTVCMLILNSYRTIYQKDSVPNLVHIIILRHPVMADFGSKRAKFKVARLASVCLSEITHDDIQFIFVK